MIRINRTTAAVVVLSLAAIGLSVFGVAGSAVGAAQDNQSTANAEDLSLGAYNDGTYSVVQGDQCVQIDPLGDGYQTAEEYYDYRHPGTDPSSYMYSSHGTTHVQAGDTSRFFLQDGGDGLNLVLVHGSLEGTGDGGRVTFVFTGLPADGEWAVKDDQYDLGNDTQNDDVWDSRGNASRVSWVWDDGRTDGGVYSNLGDDFEITIQPAFNDVADLQLSDGEITDWQVVSGNDRNPQATSLDMTEPVTIRSGGCTAVTGLDVDTSGDDVGITANVTNTGVNEETVTVPIALDGEVVDEQELTVGPNETVTFNASVAAGGAELLSVGSASANVESTAGSFADDLPGFGVPVAVLALLSVLALARRR